MLMKIPLTQFINFSRSRWLPSAFILASIVAMPAVFAKEYNRDSLAVQASAKFTVTPQSYPGLTNPNPRGGWYYKCANVVLAKDGALVACWQLSDNHTSIMSHIFVARSLDGGKTWQDYQSIAQANVWEDMSVWVVPQMSALRDGRLVIISDLGMRGPGQDFPMLSAWQKPNRGMSNHVFWSSDHGKTWTKGEKIDEVGGEPGYIVELADGNLAYTRTSSAVTDQLRNPPAPWNNVYYRNEIVFSRDGGKTWPEKHWLADSPFHGDCEVGLAETSPGHLLAVSRIGLGNGRFGHPSRVAFSDDSGRTWPRFEVAPFYAQRPHVQRLQSGKYLVTYRNVWGTPGSRAIVFDPSKDMGFQPNSWILDETRCELSSEQLTLRTLEGKKGAVEFNLYPAQSDDSRIEIVATLKVESAEANSCSISAGCWINFQPGRVSLAGRPEVGFEVDARTWHTYRIVREKGVLTIAVDGIEKLRSTVGDLWVREVRFGNRSVPKGSENYTQNAGVSHWKSVAAKVTNDTRDVSIDWSWSPVQGYPDQFRRDRTVVLDYAHPADCGYSSWTQLPDGRIVILDYTNGGSLESYSWGGKSEGAAPFIRAYLVTEADLVRSAQP